MIHETEAYLDLVVQEMTRVVTDPKVVLDADDDSSMPADMRNWLAGLRLLDGVPFANLVADSELLPAESIRWFYLDRNWTDALVQGALSVGTVNTDDRAHLTARYQAIRSELDAEERNLRRPAGGPRLGGGAGPVSGFLLRSRIVSGWPGLHVRAFSIDPTADGSSDDARIPDGQPGRMRLLRLERLAPAVLLCLFDGIPKVVHIEEPRQGIQFGFLSQDQDGERRAQLHPRDVETFKYLDVNGDGRTDDDDRIDVPFRAGASGVVDIQQLERQLGQIDSTGAADSLDSAEYALQLVRFPWRQVFGDVANESIGTVFRPTINYGDLVRRTFVTEVDDA